MTTRVDEHYVHCGCAPEDVEIDPQTTRCLRCGKRAREASIAEAVRDRNAGAAPRSPSRAYRAAPIVEPVPGPRRDPGRDGTLAALGLTPLDMHDGPFSATFDTPTTKRHCPCGGISVWRADETAPASCAFCGELVAAP
jgi:hypothetical protein